MPEVPRTVTPLAVPSSSAQLLSALRAGGIEPNGDQARLLLAQIWLETAAGKSCNNMNPGNITAGPKWAGDFFRPLWFTVDASSSAKMVELHNKMLKGQAPNAFRAYDTFEHGFSDYVSQLVHTFPSILRAAETGDAGAVASAIKTSGYAPDAPPGTDRSLATLARQFEAAGVFAQLPKAEAPAAPASPSCS